MGILWVLLHAWSVEKIIKRIYQVRVQIQLKTNFISDAKDSPAELLVKHTTAKKRRKSRTAFSNHQVYELEKRFLYMKYLTPADRDEIANNLSLTNAQVSIQMMLFILY